MQYLNLSGQPRLSFRLALLLICTAICNPADADNFPVSFKRFVFDSPTEPTEPSSMASKQSESNDQSAACMQCHDGTAAQAITLENSDMPSHYRNRGDNHPVGIDYARYADQNPGNYVALTALDRRIQLEHGEVTCVSCHQTKSSITTTMNSADASPQTTANNASGCTSSKLLTTGADQGRLCMSCHII